MPALHLRIATFSARYLGTGAAVASALGAGVLAGAVGPLRSSEGTWPVASVEQCEEALGRLASMLSGADAGTRKRADFDRSLSCTLRDLGVTFLGHLHDGTLDDIRRSDGSARADVRLTMVSDDLLRLVDGELNLGRGIATGRVAVSAGIRDLLRLRSMF